MSKTPINITDSVMTRIQTGEVRMKPRWHFIVGSLVMFLGLISVVVVTVFLISLISFSLRTHGPMGEIRYQQMLASFPWWAPFIALVGIIGGILLLKKFDLSYKKNFLIIIVTFIGSIVVAGLVIDYLGLDSLWAKGRVMQGLYQQYGGNYRHRGQGRGPI